ncbi:hypothetical protein [Dolichospermum sp. UHCC 0259]|uniref:hypothetical protein n=1 Tax=Dolichospermum sp. UHCC 0259 TaxID=2590010 RepID=UPI0014481193|nr:hypothetical protein [Dolichospermum sp. UHCC 0259]MTJ49179.1 hypothetical protein [Dolichospermum sp. UHCC 0259]
MKKLIPTISIILSCISLISCGITPQDRVPEDSSDTVTQSQRESSSVAGEDKEDKQESSPVSETQENETNQEDEEKLVRKNLDNNKNTNKQPKVGTVTKLVNGDLMCYVTLVDKKGIEHNVGATFEICAEEEKFLNKKVRAVYQIESVSDCESAEPCGKTRKESIITKMEIIKDKSSTNSNNQKSGSVIVGNNVVSGELTNNSPKNTQTISNGKWTITTGNHDSWNGVNNTGNISYKGCDTNGKCLQLTGGKVSCRDGKCITGWQNGDYFYILEQPITEDGNSTSTLIVRKDNTEILNSPGLKVVSGN